jgi:hypothetical protein
MYTRTHIHTYTLTHVHTRTHLHTYTRTHLHTYTLTHIHTYAHVHTYTRTHVHTYTRTPECRHCPFLAWRILALHVGVGAVCGDWRCMCSFETASHSFANIFPLPSPGFPRVGAVCRGWRCMSRSIYRISHNYQ